jgi:pyruvate,water dikinase
MEGLRKRLALLLSGRRKRVRRLPVAERFAYFRAIGKANDAFLRHLAGLQEMIDRSTIAEMGMTASATEALSAHVGAMVTSLVAMSGGRYDALQKRYETLDREIRPEIRKTRPVEGGPVVVWPTDDDVFRPQVVGPKAARVAEAASITGIEVPSFFSVSAYGYHLFMQASGLQDLVRELESVDPYDTRALKGLSDGITDAIAGATLPPGLESELLAAYDKLLAANPGMTGVAVRSSAVVEDTESSFAGQFESILNVRKKDFIAAYKQVVASKYHHQALKYAFARGFSDEDVAMPVLVMTMVQPSASGVAYSRCLARPASAMVTAVSGLAQAAVDGRVIPDTFMVAAGPPVRVEEISLGNRAFSLRCADDGGLLEAKENASSTRIPVLQEEAACRVACAARALEHHFGSPQDVEWALDESGSLMVVQTRRLYLSPSQVAPNTTSVRIEGYRILLHGAARASGGVASGRIFHLLDPQTIETVPEGAILCVPTTSPRLAGVMGTVRGVVAAAGSPTGHMATIAREFDTPCLVGAENAMAALPHGMLVTLDADAGVVYEGEVPELLHSDTRSCAPCKERNPHRENLQHLIQRVAPLTLTEPDTPAFCPNNCQTFHDIARFVHQKSMAEMFALDDLAPQERRAARRLLWRVPMEVLLLDLGGGLAVDADRTVPIDKVTSIPLLALIEGMTDPRLRWSGPVGFNFKGFMSVVVRSAADDQRYGEPNYCLCAADYIHFATRLAYHFATVDAICGQSVNENYARFLFFGGAAVAARREWRAHFLATVLKRNGFVVKQVGDRVEAILAKRDSVQLEEALVMLGRLMVASRHLDMVIESQAVANALAQAFLSGDYGFERVRRTGA